MKLCGPPALTVHTQMIPEFGAVRVHPAVTQPVRRTTNRQGGADMTDAMPREEIRFAVVLNGGVSLAVWMGGVVLELDRLTRSDGLYQDLLELVGCTARADVIA